MCDILLQCIQYFLVDDWNSFFLIDDWNSFFPQSSVEDFLKMDFQVPSYTKRQFFSISYYFFLLLFLCSDSFFFPVLYSCFYFVLLFCLLSPWCAHSRKPYKLISVKSSHWWLYGTMLHGHKILLSDEASVHLLLCPVHFVSFLMLSRRLVPSLKRAWQDRDYDRILIFADAINS